MYSEKHSDLLWKQRSLHLPPFIYFYLTVFHGQLLKTGCTRSVTSSCDMIPMVRSRSSGQFNSLPDFVLDVIVSVGIKGWAFWFAKTMTSPKHIFMKVLSGQYIKGLVPVLWVKQHHLTAWRLCFTLECVFSISVMFSHCVL